MANTRKVLINRHSTKNQAPSASEMFHGEIAVSHPTDLSATTIYTRNNDVMVPFASCAMTMQMIDNAIAAADVSYEVKKAEGEAFINVGKSVNGSAVTFTVSSEDIQSKAAFDTYSAATDATIKENYNTLSGAIDDVLDIITTAITGDAIISVNPSESGAGAYSLTHKTGDVASGFNKLTTDAYGHVTAHTAVDASDIKALGFEDSAWTEQKITDAIEALDSEGKVSAAGKYLTGIGIANGKISGITEADIPVLSVTKTGSGNVVSDITVNNHQISFTTASVATSDDIQKLSAATINLSAATTAISEDLETLSGIVETFSAATVTEFNSAFTAIQGMDKAADAVAGQVVTTVAQEDGKVTETKANVKDLQLGGYVKDTTATGAIAGTDTINTALSKLENIVAANKISNADGSINVTTGATGTDINVNIKSGEKVLAKDGAAGLYTDLDLVKITTGLPATVKERYQLLATDDSKIGVNIDIAKDSHIVSIRYITDSADAHYQNLEYKYLDVEGTEQTEYVDVSSLVLEAEFASGVTVTNHVAHGVVDPTSETFLTVGADGFKLSGVQDAIDAKVNALDVTGDTAAAGQYVAAIQQTDGLVAVKTRANVSEAVLNNYAKGTDATAVAATDTVNQAISKLENQVDAAKAAATTKVVEGTDAGNNMTIVPTTGSDGSVTYTVNLDDVASATALTAEIAARKAVDGQNGDTYVANSSANYISGATSLNDADVKLDAAIKDIADIIKDLDSTGTTSDSGHYLTAITITDGKITAVGQEVLPAATPVTTAAGTTGNTAVAVLAGITPGGTDGHELTLNMTNKVFSAVTAESAVTSLSAQTSVSANMAYELSSAATITSGQVTNFVEGVQNIKVNSAYTAESADTAAKVANALTMTDGTATQTYDGSAARSLTFGTATSSTGVNGRSMSMTSAGVVDVEIIDCGEY